MYRRKWYVPSQETTEEKVSHYQKKYYYRVNALKNVEKSVKTISGSPFQKRVTLNENLSLLKGYSQISDLDKQFHELPQGHSCQELDLSVITSLSESLKIEFFQNSQILMNL
jgi:hypothetical protein